MPSQKGLYYGWVIVLACGLMFVWGGGVFYYGFTAFFNPIVREFGWSRALTSMAFSLQSVESSLLAPLAGILADRWGPRRLLLAGVAIAGLGLLLLSLTNSLRLFYIAFLVAALGFMIGFGLVSYVAVANWFQAKRGRAMALLAAGYGLSGVLAPLLVWLITSLGWRQTLIILGLGTWAIGLPLAALVRNRPESSGRLPDGQPQPQNDPAAVVKTAKAPKSEGLSVGESLRASAFWLLALGTFLAGIGQSAVVVHEIPALVSVSISAETAAWAVTLTLGCSLIGRLGFGYMGDFIDKRLLLALAAALQAIGMVIFAFTTSIWTIVPFAFFYGIGYAAPIPVRPALQADYFGLKTFGTVQGFMMVGWTLGGILGPFFAGWVFDVAGSYRWAFLLLSVLALLAIPANLMVKPPLGKAIQAASPSAKAP